MANIYFSDFFGITPEDMADWDYFDVSLINDLPLFVDPFLLFNSEEQELQALHAEIIKYMRFLKGVAESSNVPKGLVSAWFTFREVKQNWLGFSQTGNSGHGLGMKFANSLVRNLSTVFRDFGEETVTKASHIEKLCLIRDGVGRDNISDFATNLIKGWLAEKTEVFARAMLKPEHCSMFPIEKAYFNYETTSWVTKRYYLPRFNNDFVLLTPRRILTKDDSWINRSDLVDQYTAIASSLPDEDLRSQVNAYLVRVLPSDPNAKESEIDEAISRAIERYPEVLDYYIKKKEETSEKASSEAATRRKQAERVFILQIRALVEQHLENTGFYQLGSNSREDAMRRLQYLKDVIENKGGHRAFYLDGTPVRRESDLQIMYRLTWFASVTDIAAEVNDGRGPADFVASRTALDKTVVELKLAKNTKLEQNLKRQAEIYSKASSATHAPIKGIIYFTEAELHRVQGILSKLGLSDSHDIVLIDACDNKPSASNAR